MITFLLIGAIAGVLIELGYVAWRYKNNLPVGGGRLGVIANALILAVLMGWTTVIAASIVGFPHG